MAIVLGIDTGGTYTDGVILDRETKEIFTATKALTTHNNLIEGIRNTICQLNYKELEKIDYVALSTTLATNAIVENKGCRVGLLMLGFVPEEELPPCECVVIPGKIDLSGHETESVDFEMAKAAVESFRDKVDAIAISGIFSVRNPEHEKAVKEAVADTLGVPVIMAHELTGTLGVQERTNTAVLNAKLISVIEDLISAVKAVLDEKNISVPLMIVKGDGSLMDETLARERPIETILSGPAASIIGATYLNDVTEGLILDMGGTTTDIAILENGKPCLSKEGADVGGWRTRVSAVNAHTFGLGGDSRIFYNPENGGLEVGPRKSWPVSMVSAGYPYYKDELLTRNIKPLGLAYFDQTDGLILLRQPGKSMKLNETHRKIIAALADGPHTVMQLGRVIGIDPNFFYVEKLIEYGILGLVGFTPSDILCAKGAYEVGDQVAAQIAASSIAKAQNLTEEAFFDCCFKKIRENMCKYILTCVLDRNNVEFSTGDVTAEYFYKSAVEEGANNFFGVDFKLNVPIVGIGAPVQAWLPSAAEKFHGDAVISSHHEVANAIGAAAGKVMTIFSLLVRNQRGESLTIFAPWGRRDYDHEAEPTFDPNQFMTFDKVVEMAVKSATEEGIKHLEESMLSQGIEDYQILVERKDVRVIDGYSENVKLYIETKIDVIAVGLPGWREKSGL
jgi:N-methylhydantoinase A/oxoprolinase/acetone carboxylase beta subunit